MNIQKMMKQAQEMQTKIQDLQAKLDEAEMDGAAGGGLVKVRLSGKNRALKVSIDPSLLKADEKETLEDLLIVAINDARAKLDEQAGAQMSALSSGLNLPPGLKLPF
jgi:DNA-binding YbaB/EbfC family protein